MNQVDELRRIIIGDSLDQLSVLKERIENLDARTKDVAEVLAPAIGEGSKNSDDIINALQKPVSEGLKRAIRSEPVEYADILYPAIAPSIRLAISQAISSLLATINQTMESATSISGVRMRMEAARTGVPYAELALRNAILYRVEHIYLIDRETGLLIEECAATGTSSLDSDAVSAMFSAIQSFVQDSFSGTESDRLTDLKVGAHKVWVAHGPKAMLACVILGDAPEALKLQLNNCLDQIRTKYSQQISSFDGDSSTFEGVDLHMRPLLQLRLKENDDALSKTPLATKFLVCGLVLLSIYLLTQWFDKYTKLSTVERYLAKAPGFLITSAQWQDDQIVVEGLQDPDAELPTQDLLAYGIEAQDLLMQTTPFRSLEIEMEMSRFKAELNLPDSLALFVGNNVPAISGEASVHWLIENDLRLRHLSSDRRLNIDQLMASQKSVSEYLDEITRSQADLTNQVNFIDVHTEFKSVILDQMANVSWEQVPISALSRNTLLNQLNAMLNRPLDRQENVIQDSGSLN